MKLIVSMSGDSPLYKAGDIVVLTEQLVEDDLRLWDNDDWEKRWEKWHNVVSRNMAEVPAGTHLEVMEDQGIHGVKCIPCDESYSGFYYNWLWPHYALMLKEDWENWNATDFVVLEKLRALSS